MKSNPVQQNNLTSSSSNKLDIYNSEMKNHKKKITNFFYDNYYFHGIADLIFARVLFKKYHENKSDHSHDINKCLNYYLSSLKTLNNTLDQKNIFIANLNMEIGRFLNNQSQNVYILKSINFYTNSYIIYQEHKEELWEIFKIVLVDLCKLNSKMGFLQVALNYGIEFLTEYDKYERNDLKRVNEEFKEVAYNCMQLAEHTNKNTHGIDTCRKLFEKKIFIKQDENNKKIENYKDSISDDEPSRFQFISKFLKFIIKDLKDEKLKNYYDWLYYFKNIFDGEGKTDGKFNTNERITHIISSVENGDIKDFKNYFLALINNFHFILFNNQNLNGNFDIVKSDDEKIRNLRHFYLLFKDEVFN